MAEARTVPVLMHHHVSPSPGMITVSPENFESQIAWLAGNGWTSLTLDQYAGFLAGKPVPRKSIVITFDDGYLDNWVYAHPILHKYGMHAVVFVVTGWMGEGPERPHAGIEGATLPATPDHRGCEAAIYEQDRSDDVMMRWSEARASIAAGTFEMHCHTHTHTRWLRRNDLDRAQRRAGLSHDLAVSREVLALWRFRPGPHRGGARARLPLPAHHSSFRPQPGRRRPGTHLPVRHPQPAGQLAAQAHQAELQPADRATVQWFQGAAEEDGAGALSTACTARAKKNAPASRGVFISPRGSLSWRRRVPRQTGDRACPASASRRQLPP
jgi:peptidoglycan/xylan/chitin deacetylase (PgdA/CDA1 family)